MSSDKGVRKSPYVSEGLNEPAANSLFNSLEYNYHLPQYIVWDHFPHTPHERNACCREWELTKPTSPLLLVGRDNWYYTTETTTMATWPLLTMWAEIYEDLSMKFINP